MAGLVPAISIIVARAQSILGNKLCPVDRDRRVKPGDDACGCVNLIGTARAVGMLYLRLPRRELRGALSLSSGSAFWMLRASRMTSRQDASST